MTNLDAEQLQSNMNQIEKDQKSAKGQQISNREQLRSETIAALTETQAKPPMQQILELQQIQSSRIEELFRLLDLQQTNLAKLIASVEVTLVAIEPDLDRLELLLDLAVRLVTTLDAFRQNTIAIVKSEMEE